MSLEKQVLRAQALIATRALEAAQWEVRSHTGVYELPNNERMLTVERALNHFRNILEEPT